MFWPTLYLSDCFYSNVMQPFNVTLTIPDIYVFRSYNSLCMHKHIFIIHIKLSFNNEILVCMCSFVKPGEKKNVGISEGDSCYGMWLQGF